MGRKKRNGSGHRTEKPENVGGDLFSVLNFGTGIFYLKIKHDLKFNKSIAMPYCSVPNAFLDLENWFTEIFALPNR